MQDDKDKEWRRLRYPTVGFENPNEEARYQAYKARLLEELGAKPFIQAKKDYSEEFLEFWKIWPVNPRKESKGECYKIWLAKKLKFNSKEIIAHVEYCKQDKWKDPQFIPAPLVYLRSARWDGAVVVDVLVNGKPWHDSASGIEAKGKELGIVQGRDEGFPQYSDRVLLAAGHNDQV